VSYGAAAYLKLVTRWKMPDYQLTEEFLGREIRPATAYAVQHIEGQEADNDAPSTLKKFLAQYNDTGLPAVRLVFFIGQRDRKYWMADLPGCAPEGCLDKDYSDLLVQAHPSRWLSSRPSGFNRGGGLHNIYESRILGMHVESYILFETNKKGEAVTYSVKAKRTTTWNPIDRSINSLKYPFSGEHEFIDLYRKNLVLNTTS